MPQLLESILDQVRLATILDIGITALLIYWLFSLIRGTSAVRLVIGVTVLFAVYFAARILDLRLLTQILETGAVVGLFALVVVFQPELRRALDRIGRVGSLGWLVSAEGRTAEQVATEVARGRRGAVRRGPRRADGHRARDRARADRRDRRDDPRRPLGRPAADDLLAAVAAPRRRGHRPRRRILAAGAVLPLGETTMHSERFGTRHRAALGTTEQTDAIVVVVSEENGQISLVERARIGGTSTRRSSRGRCARSWSQPADRPASGSRRRAGGGSPRFAELRPAVRAAERAADAGAAAARTSRWRPATEAAADERGRAPRCQPPPARRDRADDRRATAHPRRRREAAGAAPRGGARRDARSRR